MNFKKEDLFEIIYDRLLIIGAIGAGIVALGAGVFIGGLTDMGLSIAFVGSIFANGATIPAIVTKLIENK